MSLCDKVLVGLNPLEEGAQRGTLRSAVAGLGVLFNDIENAVKGKNGSADRPHPDARAIVKDLKKLKTDISQKFSTHDLDFLLWFRQPGLTK